MIPFGRRGLGSVTPEQQKEIDEAVDLAGEGGKSAGNLGADYSVPVDGTDAKEAAATIATAAKTVAIVGGVGVAVWAIVTLAKR